MNKAFAPSILALIAMSSTASAQTIPADCDCWVTDPGTTFRLPDLPAGFFGPGSDPFITVVIPIEGLRLPASLVVSLCPGATEMTTVWVDPHGTPVAPDDAHAVSSVMVPVSAPIDSIICRPNDLTFTGTGVPTPVAIEIVALSLKSVSPITVTYNGGMTPTPFDVFITEDGVQATGQMTLTANSFTTTTSDGGVVVDSLPVNFQLQFQQAGGGPIAVGLPGLSIDFTDTNGSFGYVQAGGGGGGVPAVGYGAIGALALFVALVGFFMIRRRHLTTAS